MINFQRLYEICKVNALKEVTYLKVKRYKVFEKYSTI